MNLCDDLVLELLAGVMLTVFAAGLGHFTSGQPPGPKTAGPLTHIRSIIYLLYHSVMSQFYQLLLHDNVYLQLSCQNRLLKSVIGRRFLVCLLYVYECHDVTAHDIITTTSKMSVTACHMMTTMSKIRAKNSGH